MFNSISPESTDNIGVFIMTILLFHMLFKNSEQLLIFLLILLGAVSTSSRIGFDVKAFSRLQEGEWDKSMPCRLQGAAVSMMRRLMVA